MLLVIDANELFAAMIARGITLNLFFDRKLDLVSPRFILEEYKEHKEDIVNRSGLSEEEALSFLLLLTPKIKFFEKEEFKDFLKEAEEISPDSNDVEYFALALKLNCPIWSEDKALKSQSKVKVYSTSELLKEIGL